MKNPAFLTPIPCIGLYRTTEGRFSYKLSRRCKVRRLAAAGPEVGIFDLKVSGFANTEGVEFHMRCGNGGGDKKPKFTFYDGTTTKSYTLTSDMTYSYGSALQAFKLDYSKLQ